MPYTVEETKYIIDTYLKNPTIETIDEIGAHLGKNRNQIIGKLSKEGLYQRKRYVDKNGKPPVTKLELVDRIAQATQINIFRLEGLDKAPKLALLEILRYVEKDNS